MNWTYAGGVGIFLGVAVGVGASQLHVPPLLQSMAAAPAAVLFSTALTFFYWFQRQVSIGHESNGYFAFGVENLLYMGVLLVLSAVFHVVLGVSATALPWVVEHRALILGGAGGLYGAVSVARVLSSFRLKLG